MFYACLAVPGEPDHLDILCMFIVYRAGKIGPARNGVFKSKPYHSTSGSWQYLADGTSQAL
jgi:hypothetical protein